jgi:hypothetical protein
MKLYLAEGLAFTSVTLSHQGRTLHLDRVLVDTGSAGTQFQVDQIANIGLVQEPHDMIHRVFGVGGGEFVFSKTVEQLSVGGLVATPFQIEVGAMDYGLELEGILGMDFLLQVGAVLDLARLEIHPA